MKLPKASWQTREGMGALLEALGAGAGDTRYVGGCVRDTLLDIAVSDIDLATRLTPQDVIERVRRAGLKPVPTGLAHGTITAVLPDGVVEITTLRRDVSTDGRRATIAYTEDWKEDAARRDFTINALSAEPSTFEIFDYFGGLDDLEARELRFIGDPLTRIAEDHLRILRFFRFHARFGRGDPDPHALRACAERANDLMALSRERIADELLKLLALPDPAPSVGIMVQENIFRPVLPEITQASVDRLSQLIETERQAGVEGGPLRRLSALLPANPDLAAAVAPRLRLSAKALKRLVSAAFRSESDATDPKALAYRIGGAEAVDRLLLQNEPEKAADLAGWTRPRFRFGGGDLIAMGLKAGPMVAAALQAIEREWAAIGFPEDEMAQRDLARRHVDQALRDIQ
ncbi:MAG: CCA tRNA nucleotidyltransferase [Sphingosinicella sp.]|nr:CCA tRNA nucleotidyltransferase [Sphingosinicella sp.]